MKVLAFLGKLSDFCGFDWDTSTMSSVEHTCVFWVDAKGFCSLIGIALGLLTWPLENDEHTCRARMWVLPIMATLFLAPIAAKLWRIKTTFNAPAIKKINISQLRVDDVSLLKYVGCMQVPVLLISMLWTIINPLEPRIVSTDPYRPSLNYTDCGVCQRILWIIGCMSTCDVVLSCSSMFSDQKDLEEVPWVSADGVCLVWFHSITYTCVTCK